MSIDKDLLEQMMEGREPGDLFGKDGILAELTVVSSQDCTQNRLKNLCLQKP